MENNCEANPACLFMGFRTVGEITYLIYRCAGNEGYDVYIQDDNESIPIPDTDPLSFKRES